MLERPEKPSPPLPLAAPPSSAAPPLGPRAIVSRTVLRKIAPLVRLYYAGRLTGCSIAKGRLGQRQHDVRLDGLR